MADRPKLSQQPVIVDGDMSGDIVSKPTILNQLTVGTYTYSWSGTSPVGSVSVQISNDYSLNANGTVLNPGTWVTVYFTLNGSSVVNSAPISGNSGEGAIEWTTGANAIRTIYTFASGVGTLQAVFNGKVT
jgi:hypothetical protein